MTSEVTETVAVAPIVKSVHVTCSPERAFEVFTRDIAHWWPTATHALHPGEVREVVWEEGEGGEVYEIGRGGERALWATVLAWDPPDGFTISWRVNADADAATEVEVRFAPDGDGTRVRLEHRHWERLGDRAAETVASYRSGWDFVLGQYVAYAG